MSSPEKATETQLKNIQVRTGKTLDELSALVRQSGLTKHSEIRAMLQREAGPGLRRRQHAGALYSPTR